MRGVKLNLQSQMFGVLEFVRDTALGRQKCSIFRQADDLLFVAEHAFR